MGPTPWIVTLLAIATGAAPAASAAFPQARLTEAEWGSYHDREPEGPGTYAFGYDVEDPETGNTQFRQEQRHVDGSVTGSYGSVQPDGNVQIVHYTADHLGYRVRIENSIRKNEDYPPRPIEHSPQFVSALASQSAPPTTIYEQHVRPISNQGNGASQGNRPIKTQENGALRGNRPISNQGNGGSQGNRPITNQGNGALRGNRPISNQGNGATSQFRPIGNRGNDALLENRPIRPQGNNALRNQYPNKSQIVSKVREVYPISEQNLRQQFGRPSQWQENYNYV